MMTPSGSRRSSSGGCGPCCSRGREMAKKKPAKRAKKAPGPKPDPGPTGQAHGPEQRDLSKVPPQLRAHAHAPGSNGGVHRGPDLKPRLFIASLLIMALTEAGEL